MKPSWLVGILTSLTEFIPDPVKHCQVYKESGCSHVDGYLCGYPDCSILEHWKQLKAEKDREEPLLEIYPSGSEGDQVPLLLAEGEEEGSPDGATPRQSRSSEDGDGPGQVR